MSQQSFVHVSQAGFSAFGAALCTGSWALVDTTAYEDSSARIWNAPLTTIVKLRLQRAVAALLIANPVSGHGRECDRVWDACHMQLAAMLDAAMRSKDPDKRAAAKRLKDLFLGGLGTGQTQWTNHDEVDFGHLQMSFAEHAQAEADVALLGIEPLLAEIAAAPDSMTNSIRYGVSSVAPHKQKANALADCAREFAWAADTLQWLIEFGADGAEKDLAKELLESLEDLALRSSAPVHSKRARELHVSVPPPPHSVH